MIGSRSKGFTANGENVERNVGKSQWNEMKLKVSLVTILTRTDDNGIDHIV